MDWVAVGAIATIALVVVGYFQLRKQPPAVSPPPGTPKLQPATITYRVDTIPGSIPTELVEAVRKEEHDFEIDRLAITLSTLAASRIELLNRSDGTIEGVRLRLRIIGPVYSLVVADTKHLAKEAVRLEPEGDSVRVTIDEMPKDEIIVLSAFHDFRFASVSLKSERGSIEVIEADLYSIRTRYER